MENRETTLTLRSRRSVVQRFFGMVVIGVGVLLLVGTVWGTTFVNEQGEPEGPATALLIGILFVGSGLVLGLETSSLVVLADRTRITSQWNVIVTLRQRMIEIHDTDSIAVDFNRYDRFVVTLQTGGGDVRVLQFPRRSDAVAAGQQLCAAVDKALDNRL